MLSKTTTACTLLAMLACFIAQAQIDFSISPSPVGSGARAAGMADAFVAVADDATAASWNPAGLVQLERPEISIVGEFLSIRESLDATNNPEFISTQDADNADLNFFSAVHPIPWTIGGRNAVVSFSYQRKFDFTRELNVNIDRRIELDNGSVVEGFSTQSFEQKGGFAALTPAFAIELTNTFSLGLALNLWRSTFISDNDWSLSGAFQNDTFIDGELSRQNSGTDFERHSDFKGENFTFGALWNATARWTIGLRYDTAFSGDVDYRLDSFRESVGSSSFEERREIHFPDSYALGVAFRPNDNLKRQRRSRRYPRHLQPRIRPHSRPRVLLRPLRGPGFESLYHQRGLLSKNPDGRRRKR